MNHIKINTCRNSARADAWTSLAGRTDTRLKRGSPAVRYESGVVSAEELLEQHRKSKLVDRFFKRQSAVKLPLNCGSNATIVIAKAKTLANIIDEQKDMG